MKGESGRKRECAREREKSKNRKQEKAEILSTVRQKMGELIQRESYLTYSMSEINALLMLRKHRSDDDVIHSVDS